MFFVVLDAAMTLQPPKSDLLVEGTLEERMVSVWI